MIKKGEHTVYRIGNEEAEAVRRVIDSKQLFKVNGGLHEAQKAEEELCATFASPHAILMTSGHAALVSALVAMGIGPGDQVIVPAYTYIATAMAVVAAGAIPVICEVDDTLTMDPDDMEARITPATRAVIPVHIQGFPCQMDKIMAIARRHGLLVLEDACQADGGSFGGRRLGTIGDAGALSFNFYKVITCGEGGALLTGSREIFERALIYHDSSAIAFFGNQMQGFSATPFCGNEYRTNEIPAAILRVQLSRLDGILADLRSRRAAILSGIGDAATPAPSHDGAGDCATTLALRFETAEHADRVARAIGGICPINTDKHVYCNWGPILERRGALHPAMDPFRMEANRGIVPDYRRDMCPRTLDLLARTVYLSLTPDMSDAECAAIAARIRATALS